MDNTAKENSGTKYFLLAVDFLSRYLRVQPLKNRYSTTVKDAFLKIINNEGPFFTSIKLWLDKGKEPIFCADKKIGSLSYTQQIQKLCRGIFH